jgi:polar amino acid transport system permease protein
MGDVRRHDRAALFLWGMALPLAAAPAPIGPAAEQFADGARITVGLTLIAGSAGVLIGVLAGLGKLSRFWPLRWLCDSYVWLIRGTPCCCRFCSSGWPCR